MITSSLEVSIWPVQHAKRLSFICGLDHLSILKNVGEDLDTKNMISVNPISGRWQAPAAVLPGGPKNIGDSHSRARRARGRAKLSLRFGACQCYYMFFPIQPKIAIFTAQFKYLNDGQNA